METLQDSRSTLPGPPAGGLRRSFEAWRDRFMTSPGLHRRAAALPFVRQLMRRRASRLFELMAGFVHSQVLLGCVRMGLFETLLERPRTLDELANASRTDRAALARLIDSAVSLGLLERRDGERIGLGPLGTPMAAHKGLREMVEHNAILYRDLHDPLQLLGDPQRSQMNAYWPYSDKPASGGAPAAGPDQFSRYSQLMASSQRFVIDEMLAAYPFSEHRCVLDVGGGLGGWVTELARHAPHLQLKHFDLPGVSALARERIAAQGLSHRIEVCPGSFVSDPLPRGADLITLVRVAHDHPDEVVLALLRAIHDALPVGGTLLIAEPMAHGSGAQAVSDPYFHFYLLAMGSGRLRSAEALGALMREAGFAQVGQLPNPMPLHAQLVTGTRAQRNA
jgi:demethylspheroidene O-methyltransferase